MATAEVDEGTVYLDLTHDEADALVVVLGRVGGYPDGRRKHTSDIYYALAGAGVPLSIDQERADLSGSMYFSSPASRGED